MAGDEAAQNESNAAVDEEYNAEPDNDIYQLFDDL